MEKTSKTTLGLSRENDDIIDDLMNTGLFSEKQDVAKIAVVLAIKENKELKPIEGVETVWNIGTFDDTGEIKKILEIIYPDFEGSYYKLLESLINQGLEIFQDKHDNTDYDFELANEIL